jgi:general secretion pathway protein D
MSLKDSITNRQVIQRLMCTALCLMFVFYVGAGGCKSEPENVAADGAFEHIMRPIESEEHALENANPPADIIETDSSQWDNASVVAASEEQKTSTSGSTELMGKSEAAELFNRTVSTPEKIEIPVYKEKLAASGSTIASGEQSSRTEVNLPILAREGVTDDLISVNFDHVDIRIMLKTIGDITGINFVLDDNVQGNVTVMSPTKIRLSEVYRILESILEVKGYAAVPSGNLVKIVPRAKATRHNLQVRVGSNPADIPQNDSLVTQIIPLEYADASEVGQIIKPLLDGDAHTATYTRTNSILITDRSANIHHIAKIIQKLDVAGSKEEVTVIRLNYASSQVLSEQITRIMQKNKAAGSVRNGQQITTDVKILPDVRTNSLIVVANSQDTETIEQLAMKLDIERPLEASNVHVIYLKNAQAKEAAESLTSALANLQTAGAFEGSQGIQIAPDEGTNALIITASAQDYEVISSIAEKLDIVREQVLVEMLIVEVSEDDLEEIGIDWATLDDAVTSSVRAFASTNFGTRIDYVSGDLEGLSVGAWKETGSGISIGAILHALQKKTGVNILSTPHIMTSNHQKAKIIVGENRPFVMESRITETTDFITPTVIKTFEYKDVGISLEIVPHISQGGLVRLEIVSEFTKLVEDVTTTSSDTPTTAKRQAETVVSMNSGATVVIGGLIRDDKVTLEKKVPLVGDIPLVGELFKYKKDTLEKTNLIIFITPHVLTTNQDLQQITNKKKDEMDLQIQKVQGDK